MMKVLAQTITGAILISGLVVGAVYAQQQQQQQQQHDHQAPAAVAPKPAAQAEHPPEVFCETMKTGQLCSMGTVTLLGLTPEKREAWLAAVREYNNALNTAIGALQAQAKANLSPAQVAEVNRWFAIGINPQINQLLLASGKPGEAK
jgi:hypothetical protein